MLLTFEHIYSLIHSLRCFLITRPLHLTSHKLKTTVNVKCHRQGNPANPLLRAGMVGRSWCKKQQCGDPWAQWSGFCVRATDFRFTIEWAFATIWLHVSSLENDLSTVQWQELSLHPKLQVTGVRFPVRILKLFIAFTYKWHVAANSKEKPTAKWREIKFDRSRPSGKYCHVSNCFTQNQH